MAYKFDEARAAGVSDTEIVEHLKAKGEYTYKFDEARAAGVSDTEIVEHLKARKPSTVSLPGTKKISDNIPSIPSNTIEEKKPAVNFPSFSMQEGKGIVQPEDVTATIPTSLTYGSTVDKPIYKSEAEFATIRAKELEKAKKIATTSTFPQTVTDPKTGEKTTVQPEGLETDLPMLFGKLATVRFITPEMESAFGLKVASQLSKEAQLILSRNPSGLTPEEAVQVLQGVPKDDQALALANRLGHETLGSIKQAMGKDTDRILLANELKARQQVLLDTIGTVDTKAAKAKYADMVEEIAKDYKNVHDATPVLEDLNFLEKFYGTTPSKANTIVSQMKAILAENPKISLSDALEFRGDLNYLIGKAARGKEKVKLQSIKTNIDTFIDSVATPQQKQMIDEAISTYSRTMNNEDLLEVIAKNTKEDRAVNWVKLNKVLEQENLKSPEVEVAMNIVKEFSTRFKNDAKLIAASTAKGVNPDAGGVLGAWGYIVNHLKDTLALWGDRHDNLKIQNAIIKSLRNSKTSLDFVDDIVKNKNIPPEVSRILDDAVKQIEYKPEAKVTGDVNVKPLYTTEKGTIGITPTEATLADRQTQLLREHLKDSNLEDKVIPKVHEIMQGNRINNILKQVNTKMKIDDDEGNKKMLQTIVTKETEELIRYINKSTGVMLPKSEADKIIKMKIDDILKECE